MSFCFPPGTALGPACAEPDCCDRFKQVVAMHMENNRFNTAAKIYKEIAEIEEKEGNIPAAMVIFDLILFAVRSLSLTAAVVVCRRRGSRRQTATSQRTSKPTAISVCSKLRITQRCGTQPPRVHVPHRAL